MSGEQNFGIREEELRALDEAKTEDEWNAICDVIKLARGGKYPEDWHEKVIAVGRLQAAKIRQVESARSKVGEYRRTVLVAQLCVALLAKHDLEEMLGRISRAETLGPMLDPTLHREKAGKMQEDRELLEAALPLRRLASKLGGEDGAAKRLQDMVSCLMFVMELREPLTGSDDADMGRANYDAGVSIGQLSRLKAQVGKLF